MISSDSASYSTTDKFLFIKTYGCQMNVYDSDRMSKLLEPLGYKLIDSPNTADLIILNTCHIREKATEKVFSELGRLRKLKVKANNSGKKVLLAVAGCVAQAEGDVILSRAPFVDIVFGPQTYHRLPEMITKASVEPIGEAGYGAGIIDTEFPVESKFDYLPDDNVAPSSALLTIQEGCDKFCSFCVVPYTRGAEESRPTDQIIKEALNLVRGGARELILLGQNVNAYHGISKSKKEWSLARLIGELADIDGLARIRYMTSHPKDMSDDLISAHGDVPQLMPYLHLPVQSGSDRMLRAMNRKHDSNFYLKIIEKLKKSKSDIALSSDFIVGHPEESNDDFAATLRLISEVNYSQAYSFKYSPRPGTPASTAEQIPEAIKSDRLQTLQQLLGEQQLAFNIQCTGSSQKILVEKQQEQNGQLSGRSPFMQTVHFDGPSRLVGQIVNVKIKKGSARSLSGRIATGQANDQNIEMFEANR
jgi:tRNA-2-methylthio-N6-dimethylallyladenosine synthase